MFDVVAEWIYTQPLIKSLKWLHVYDNDPNSVMALNLA